MRPKAILPLLCMLLLLAGCAAPPSGISPDDSKAYQTIATAEAFCSEAVGYAGDTPDVVIAFRALLKSPQADVAFKRLLDEATTVGKLYALCGIYYTDAAFFDQAVKPFSESSEQVQKFMGCSISRDTVGSIVERNSTNVVRLKSRSQTIKEWAMETKPERMSYDIIGGGWPNSFKESGGY